MSKNMAAFLLVLIFKKNADFTKGIHSKNNSPMHGVDKSLTFKPGVRKSFYKP
jgi:hypothetical protein